MTKAVTGRGRPRRVPFVGGLMCVAALLAKDAGAASPRAIKGPYLQSLAPDSVEIRVELDSAADVAIEISALGVDGGAPRTIRDASLAAFHIVRVSGLTPSTRYAYALQAGGDAASTLKGELTTAPRPDSRDPFTFVVYGDNRTDDAAHAVVVRAMTQSPSDFLINTGDFVQVGGDKGLWQTFFDIEGPLLRDRCLFSCVGNHELIDGQGSNYLRYFGPGSDLLSDGEKPKLYGSIRWASARFFLLDAMESFDDGPERAWLDDELSRADSEDGLSWRIVVLHQGVWSAGPHGGNSRLLHAGIPELFAKHHVDLIIAGHDHIYERGYASGLRYLVSGGGGAPLYPVREALSSTRKVESAHHFVEATVGPDAIALVAKRDDGSVLDRCGFSKTLAGWDCDPAAPPVVPAKTSGPSAAAPIGATPGGARCGCAFPGASVPRGSWALFAMTLSLVFFRARARRGRAGRNGADHRNR